MKASLFILLFALMPPAFSQDTVVPLNTGVNVFTPNGDGMNDVFSVAGLTDEDRVYIFNRWGTLIYQFIGSKDQWDGRNTSGGKERPGVYFYFIQTPSASYKGTLHLLER